jgi:hypothetical protein
MSCARITYTPRHDATSELELDALAAVYRFILLESSARKEGGPETAFDEGTKPIEDSADAVRK